MGDVFNEGHSHEKPVQKVQITDFYLSRYPVTQAQWEAIMGYNPSHFKRDGKLPVETVNWNQALEFIQILNKRTGQNYRLPSEAEWEYAAREKGTKVRFGNGKDSAVSTEINFASNFLSSFLSGTIFSSYLPKTTTAVGSFPPNALGLYDMSGNVWEWCADVWHNKYKGLPLNGTAWLEGGDPNVRVVRGGSWDDNKDCCRTSGRYWYSTFMSTNSCGFRLARS